MPRKPVTDPDNSMFVSVVLEDDEDIAWTTIIPKGHDLAAEEDGGGLSPRSEHPEWTFRSIGSRVFGEIEFVGEFPFEDLPRLRCWPASVEDVRRMAVADSRPRLVRIVGLGGIDQAETTEPQLVHFTATGARAFPIDNLRYCRCWPVTIQDARALSLDETRARAVTLAGLGPLAPERWNSFNWRITGAASKLAPSNDRNSV